MKSSFSRRGALGAVLVAVPLMALSAGSADAVLIAYPNSTNDGGSTLSYTLAGGGELETSAGHLSTPGTGAGGEVTVPLNPIAGDLWDTNGLWDSGSGLIGGGSVSGTLYYSFLARRDAASSGANQPSYGALQIQGGPSILGVGNFWEAWAYSTFGVGGNRDMVYGTGGATWLDANTDTHLFLVKIDYVANGDDTFTVWLDPDPADGDTQDNLVRRTSATGDLSFDEIMFRSGNGGTGWDFDEVRFGTDMASVLPVAVPEPSGLALIAIGLLPLLRRRRSRS